MVPISRLCRDNRASTKATNGQSLRRYLPEADMRMLG